MQLTAHSAGQGKAGDWGGTQSARGGRLSVVIRDSKQSGAALASLARIAPLAQTQGGAPPAQSAFQRTLNLMAPGREKSRRRRQPDNRQPDNSQTDNMGPERQVKVPPVKVPCMRPRTVSLIQVAHIQMPLIQVLLNMTLPWPRLQAPLRLTLKRSPKTLLSRSLSLLLAKALTLDAPGPTLKTLPTRLFLPSRSLTLRLAQALTQNATGRLLTVLLPAGGLKLKPHAG